MSRSLARRRAAGPRPRAMRWALVVALLVPLVGAGCRDNQPSAIRITTDLGVVTHTPVGEVFGEQPAEIRVHVENPAPWAPGAMRLVYKVPAGWVERPLRRDRDAAEEGWWCERIPHLGRGESTRYHIQLRSVDGVSWTLPEGAPETQLSLTFKGEVSRPLLLAHVLCMMGGLIPLVLGLFFAIAYLRSGRFLGPVRRLTLIGFALLAIGTLPLGMIVEYQVFGTYWEGWPFGRDVTDTKSGLMMVLWLILLIVRGRDLFRHTRAQSGPSDRAWAGWLIALVIFTIGLYLIPHENIKF